MFHLLSDLSRLYFFPLLYGSMNLFWMSWCFGNIWGLPRTLLSYTGSQLCSGRICSPSVLMVRAGIFLLCRWCGGCGKNGYDGWKSALPAFYRHPGIALCGHAGCGDVGTVVAVINLVLKSSTKSSFYIDTWI